MATRYTVYGIWLSGPAYKVGLALSLAGEKFDYVHTHPREDAKKPEFLAKGRYGQVPLLVDHSNGRNLVQSAAILEYLADATGKFGGASPEERQLCREWMYWEFDRLATPIYRMRGQRLGLRSITQATAEMYVMEGNMALKVLDDHLNGRNWLVGSGPTIADIDIYGVVSYAAAGGFNLAQYANLSAWISRMQALAGFGTAEALLPKATQAAV
jgi:glutathione S-transferase